MMTSTDTKPAPDHAAIRQWIERVSCRWHELGDAPCVMAFRFLAEHKTPQNTVFDVRDEFFMEEAVKHVAAMTERGMNAYACVNPVNPDSIAAGSAAADKDVIAAFFNWIDCDEPAAADHARNFAGPKQAFTVVTGTIPHTRPHLYWELDAPVTDMTEWRKQQIAMAASFGSDGAVINPSRIMRIAGTVTYPDTKKQARGYVSEVTSFRDRVSGPPVPFERLRALFPDTPSRAPGSSPEAQGGGFAFDTGARESAMDRALAAANIEAGEEWHNNVIRLVGSYVSRGLTDGEIHAITDNFTQPPYTIDQTRDEVQKAIDGARAKGWTPEPKEYADLDNVGAELERESAQTPSTQGENAGAEPERKSPLEWFDDLSPSLDSNYLLKGFLDRGAMSVVYGPSNSGKTFFALDIAFHVAMSAPWRTHRAEGGGVLYLAAEGGRGVVNRVVALRQETGVCEVPLAVRRAGLDLLKSTADLQHICDLAKEVNDRAPLAMIVIDTLSRVIAGGDENSAQDMTAFIKNVDRIREITGAHIMIVHHTGKDTARGARGHSSLRAATDTEIEVQNEDGNRAAMVTKQRDHEGGQVFGFSLKSVHLGEDKDGEDVSSCIVEAADAEEFVAAKKRTKGLGGNQKLIAEAFDQMLAEGMGKPNPGGAGMPEPGQFWCVEIAELRRIAQGKMVGANTRDSFRKAWDALSADRGLFCSGENVVWRVDRRV